MCHNVHCNGHNKFCEICAFFKNHLPYHDLQQTQ